MIVKIAIVHTDFRLYWVARLVALRKYLAGKGVVLHVVEIAGKGSPYSFAGDSNHEGEGWHCIYGDREMESVSAAEAVDGVLEMLDRIDPDVVIGGAIAFPSGAAAVRWANRNRRHVVIFDDARLEDVPRNALTNWVKRQIYSLVDAVIIPAPSHDETYRYFGFSPDRINHGINAIDNAFFEQEDEACSGHLTKMLPDGPFFLVVGRQIAVKNLENLLLAYIEASGQKAFEPWSLVFVGGGPEHEKLKGIAEGSCGVRVLFLDFLSQEHLKSCYHRASALILPSHKETWGLVVNEAMASGLPVLISERCGCADALVSDGLNGYRFDPENVDQIARALGKFVSLSDEERLSMRKASKGIISEWGLSRFCDGVWGAVMFCGKNRKRSGSLWGKYLIRRWNGRYRPV
jgi:glycosyltransferase involved in cell wall biosynthesis